MIDYRIVPIEELDPADILKVVNTAFDRDASLEWFAWKHLEGPWGPSLGAAAVDAEGPIGVRLLLPWKLQVGEVVLTALRATEAATIPRAQGHGVFSALNQWMMAELPDRMIFSTPNQLSRNGYYKLGWKTIASVPHRWESARLYGPPEALQATEPSAFTPWDPTALLWRSDPRSRHTYLHVDDGAQGRLYYREIRRGPFRGVLPLAIPGDPTTSEKLWRQMVRRARAHIVLRPESQPVPLRSRVAVHRGSSLIVGWLPPSLQAHHRAFAAGRWVQADLEAVI